MIEQDIITAKRNMGNYSTKDVAFPSTREAKFINALFDAIEAGDPEMFTSAVVQWDQVTKLDNWKTSILLKIKRGMQDEPGLT
jgi:alpha-soluble NSF attachment protein